MAANGKKKKKKVRKTYFLTRRLPQTAFRKIISGLINDQDIVNRSLKMLRAKQRRFFIKVSELRLVLTYFYLFMALLQRRICKLGTVGKTHGPQAIEIKRRHVMTA